MVMPMMNIGKMSVGVFDRFVYVGKGMRLVPVPVGSVRMLVMGIVEMRMFVFQWCMTMKVRVVFREVQPHARAHEESRPTPEPVYRSPAN